MSKNGNEARAIERTNNPAAIERSDVIAILMDGDLSRLNDEQRAWWYVHECERMGLDPASRPLQWAKLQGGKLVLYADRRCGDMLAAKHRVSVKIVDGPAVKDFGQAKVIFARAVATMPDGRSVEDVGSLPVQDIVNGLMKCTTKAIRRATLRLCGWGGLDESELETIPGARVIEATVVPSTDAPDVTCPQDVLDDLSQFEDGVTVEQGAAILVDHRDLGAEDKVAAFRAVLTSCPTGTSAAALKRAIAAETDRVAKARGNASAPARVVVEQAADPLDAFRADLLRVEVPAECVPVWLRHKDAIAKLPPATRKAAWAELVTCCESAGQTDADAWLKAALKGPRDDGPKGGKKPAAPAANDADDPEREAIVSESAGDDPRANETDDAYTTHHLSAAREWIARAPTISPMKHLAASFAAHESEFGSEWDDAHRAYVEQAGRLNVGALSAEMMVSAARKARRGGRAA